MIINFAVGAEQYGVDIMSVRETGAAGNSKRGGVFLDQAAPRSLKLGSGQNSRSNSRQKINAAHRIFNSIPPTDSLSDLIGLGQAVIYPAGSHLFRQNTPAEYVFELKSGLVLTYYITSSGNRRIVDFYTAWQSIGIAIRGRHQLACQAITSAEVAVLSRETILSTTKYNKQVVAKLWSEIISERLRQEQHIVWLGSSATERVASFLLTMADRYGQSGLVELPITRRELSEYLGLTVETVSRVITSFRTKGAIAIVENSNRIEILDRERLEREAGSI